VPHLGGFDRREGRPDEALACYEQSLTMRREQGDRHGEKTSLAGLGATHRETGSSVAALAYQREAREIFERLGTPNSDPAAPAS
jgi:hypothetical protein